jgi:hypothetical protein
MGNFKYCVHSKEAVGVNRDAALAGVWGKLGRIYSSPCIQKFLISIENIAPKNFRTDSLAIRSRRRK